MKIDVLLLTCVFEKFIKASVKGFCIIPLYRVSLPGYTWRCGLNFTGINLQTLQDRDLILTLENKIRGGRSSVVGDRHVESDENKKTIYMDATNLNGHSLSQLLPYDDIEMWQRHPDLYMNKLEEILNTPDDSDMGYFVEAELKYPDNKKKQKIFPFAP